MNIIAKQNLIPIRNPYTKIKCRFKRDTYLTGVAVSSAYFLTQPVNLGVSSLVGSLSSALYVNLLSDYVDDIEDRRIQSHILIPVAMIICEHIWNMNNGNFELDFLTTFVGFFSYKLALCRILFDIVGESLKEDLR